MVDHTVFFIKMKKKKLYFGLRTQLWCLVDFVLIWNVCSTILLETIQNLQCWIGRPCCKCGKWFLKDAHLTIKQNQLYNHQNTNDLLFLNCSLSVQILPNNDFAVSSKKLADVVMHRTRSTSSRSFRRNTIHVFFLQPFQQLFRTWKISLFRTKRMKKKICFQ